MFSLKGRPTGKQSDRWGDDRIRLGERKKNLFVKSNVEWAGAV